MGCCLLLKWCVRLGIALNLHGNGRPQVTGKNKPRPLYKKNERKVIIGCLDDLRYVVFGWSGLHKSQFLGGFRTFGKLLFCPVLFIYPILVFLFSCFLLSLSLSLSLSWASLTQCVRLTLGQILVSFSVAGKTVAWTHCVRIWEEMLSQSSSA